MAVTEIMALKQDFNWPYAQVCQTLGIAYGSFKRYKARVAQKQAVLLAPGPKKTEPLKLGNLISEIRALSHGRKRTLGSTALCAHYAEQISRREFNRVLSLVHSELNRENRARQRRILWKRACVVWSMDETELGWCGQKIRLHHIQDLGSRYKFAPLAAQRISSDKVAGKLEELFKDYGAPLVLKRDNGSALNGQAVDAVLEKHLVIPLNSPASYPPYNGGMERAQRELKERLLAKLSASARYDHSLLEVYGATADGELNHKRRRLLCGKTSCQVFHSGRQALKKYNRRKRKEAFDWIKNLAVKIAAALQRGGKRHASTAWRLAVETWLQRNGIITVSPGKSVTLFPEKIGS
jgi:transposase InsO family protein